MAYDEDLAERIREVLAPDPSVTEKKMFGGLAFLVNGRMAVAVSSKGGLMARVDPEDAGKLLQRTHVEPMEMQGRPTKGWVRVAAEGCRTERQLNDWIDRATAYARGLPAK